MCSSRDPRVVVCMRGQKHWSGDLIIKMVKEIKYLIQENYAKLMDNYLIDYQLCTQIDINEIH